MDKKTKAEVRIFGNEYTLVGPETEEYIKDVAERVDAEMRRISAATKLKPIKVSVLTAVNYCDEYLKASSQLQLKDELLASASEEIVTLKEQIEALEKEKNFLKQEIRKNRR